MNFKMKQGFENRYRITRLGPRESEEAPGEVCVQDFEAADSPRAE